MCLFFPGCVGNSMVASPRPATARLEPRTRLTPAPQSPQVTPRVLMEARVAASLLSEIDDGVLNLDGVEELKTMIRYLFFFPGLQGYHASGFLLSQCDGAHFCPCQAICWRLMMRAKWRMEIRVFSLAGLTVRSEFLPCPTVVPNPHSPSCAALCMSRPPCHGGAWICACLSPLVRFRAVGHKQRGKRTPERRLLPFHVDGPAESALHHLPPPLESQNLDSRLVGALLLPLPQPRHPVLMSSSVCCAQNLFSPGVPLQAHPRQLKQVSGGEIGPSHQLCLWGLAMGLGVPWWAWIPPGNGPCHGRRRMWTELKSFAAVS